MRRVLFRMDAGPGFGAGHLSRCLALAEALERAGWIAEFAMRRSSLPHAIRLGNRTIRIDEEANACDAYWGNYDLAVVDHYGLTAVHEKQLRKAIGRIAVIDDLANRDHTCDWLIDSAPGQPVDRYATSVPAHCRCLLGADYALMGQTFVAARLPDHAITEHDPSIRVLISMGAIDSRNVSAKVATAIAGIPQIHTITVVVGSAAPHLEALRATLRALSSKAVLVIDASDLPHLVNTHDLAIGAPGVSALERACLGIPQMLIETAVNQTMLATGLSRLRAARRLGHADHLDPSAVRDAVIEMIENPAERRRLRAAGRGVVDGLGARRVAAHLATEPSTKQGRPLTARRIATGDSAILLDWQRHPATRQYFRNPNPPTQSDHERFIEARIASTAGVTEVLVDEGQPVALVRADPIVDGYEVSLVVAPNVRGDGIGSAALAYLNVLMGPVSLTAVVAEENQASLRAFAAAGYGTKSNRTLIVDSALSPADRQPRPQSS